MTHTADEAINPRKLEHIRIVMEEQVEPHPSPFEKYRLPYRTLPEVNLKDIRTETEFLGYQLNQPFIISSMTGGPDKGADINRNLAIAAEQAKVALGLGSMRVILRKPESLKSFQVRGLCPSIPLLANMGLVQLNYGYGAEEINYLIESIQADGIFLHVNPLQEAIQPEGDTDFKGLVHKLAEILPQIKKPVIIKEVGTGMDQESARMLAEAGVQWLDVSGSGGVSWVAVEGYRRQDDLGELFQYEGIPTDEALQACSKITGLNLIGGGGLRSGLDVAKALMLGAKLGTAAKPLLAPALESPEACLEVLQKLERELKVAMFACGAQDLEELRQKSLVTP